MNQQTIHLNDINFTVVAKPDSHHVDFDVYDIQARTQDSSGEFTIPEWPRIGSTYSPDTVDSLDRAEIYLSGTIKWDGCSNWDFDGSGGCALHFCTRDDLMRISMVMVYCWDWMEELCPSWSPC